MFTFNSAPGFTFNSAPGFTPNRLPKSSRAGGGANGAFPRSWRSGLVLVLLLAFSGLGRAADNTLMILGDSLSAAYGVQVEQSWVSLLKQRLERQGLDWRVANESISGETTDGGLRRLPDLLDEIGPEVVVVELGGNDGLRGFPPGVIRDNLAAIIEQSQQSGARVLLVGMQIPPNYGQAYTQAFRDIFPALAEQYDTALVPFFLADIYNRDGAMQADGIHPAAIAQEQLLDNVWPALESLLEAGRTGALSL